MRNCSLLTTLLVFSLILIPAALSASEKGGEQGPRAMQSGWSTFTRGGAVYQFDTDLDEGGSYNTSRLTIQAGRGYSWNDRTSISLALGYSYDGYDFTTNGLGIAALDPWENVHTVSLSVPIRKGFDNNWSAYLIPSLRSSGESGADFDKTFSGGGLVGIAYRFGEQLTIGPGIGVLSQLEDTATVFPILIINWKINDSLSLATGRGLGATRGPGLTLKYKADEMWEFTIGGRYEKLRFRLDKDGPVPGGIGEDKAYPLFAGCTYNFSPKAHVSLVGGVELGGELQLEDTDGNRIDKESYDPGGFFGLTFRLRM